MSAVEWMTDPSATPTVWYPTDQVLKVNLQQVGASWYVRLTFTGATSNVLDVYGPVSEADARAEAERLIREVLIRR